MADNISVTQGSGKTVATDEVTDGILGTVQVQFVKLMDGTLDSTNKLSVSAGGAAKVDGSAVTQPISGTITAIQGTGTNLHAVIDSGSTTVVTGNVTVVQPTGTNLHTVVDSGTLTAITSITNPLPAGTNVIGHVIADSGSTTAVTGNVTVVQSTAANLNATVTGTITANQGTSPWVENISQLAGTAISVNNGASDAGTQRVTIANDSMGHVEILPSSLSVTGTAAAGAAVTVTLPAVASQFHYITGLEIEAYTTVARTGSATPVIVTSTNLTGSNAWTFASAAAIGTTDTKWFQTCGAIKSAVANTNTTIVCPATTSVLWRVNVYYYTAE